MPNFKGHLFGGLTTFTLLHFAPGIKQQLSPVFSFQKIIELYLSFLGSIAPDIDIYSHGRKIFDFFVLVGCIAGAATKKYELIALLMGSFFVARCCGHRKIMHNLLFIIVAPYCYAGFLQAFFPKFFLFSKGHYIAFVFSAISHITLDAIPKKFLPKFMYYWVYLKYCLTFFDTFFFIFYFN